MPQKYKVFIGDNPLLIIAPEQFEIIDNQTITLPENPEIYQLDDLYHRLLQSGRREAVWVHPQPEVAFQKFCSLFKIVEAAGGIVRLEEKFLFILRHGKWDLPKGKAEKGESRTETAKREVEEECGFTVDRVSELAGITWHTYERDGARVLKPSYWYWMEVNSLPELSPQTEEGITRVEFLDASEIRAVLDDMYISIRELVSELRLSHPKP